uniref:Uncharacterized protein n=1 Tax=Panagrolaimus sp. ES5 TaxID=591445 RepID=A0AC34FEK8_9BILA
MFQPETVKKLVKILYKIKNLKRFRLSGLDESFDFVSFMDFIMKNETVNITIAFSEHVQLSLGYKQMLQNSVGKILTNPPKKIPDICFPGFSDALNYKEYKKLRYLQK